MNVRKGLDYLDPEKRVRSSISFLDEDGEQQVGRAKQAFKNECDINNVIKRYDKTGLITHVNNMKAHYGDYTEVNEYQDSLNIVIKAQADFDALPSELRKKFGNDPGNFVEFVTNPENNEEMVKLGLANPSPVEPQPMKVEVTNPQVVESQES